MKTHAVRLHPGDDLRGAIEAFIMTRQIQAGVVLAAAGNVTRATLRMYHAEETKHWEYGFEIVSLTGTASIQGSHLHCSLADKNAAMVGGHLKDGCIIGTTAEIVIGELEGTEFVREFDPETGFDELVVNSAA